MKKIKLNLFWMIAIFVLLFPFRLPVSVLFIEAISIIAQTAGNISEEILAVNVVITKLVYNLFLCVIFVINICGKIYTSIRNKKGERWDGDMAGYYVGLGFSFLAYIIYDCVATHQLYLELNAK